MITPIKTMTINQIIARQDDLLVSVDDVKAIAKNEVAKMIDEVLQYISTHVYDWQDLRDLRDFLKEMKGADK